MRSYSVITSFYQTTINIEPPVTDEVLLIEDAAIGTEERVFKQATHSIIGADVETLTVRLLVTIITLQNNDKK